MTRLALQNINLNVGVNGSGLPVVLLHGFTGSVQTWQPFLPALNQFCQTIAVDLPGHGLSDTPLNPDFYSLPHVSHCLAELLDLLDIDKAVIAGYSLGGRQALHFAVNSPHRVAGLGLESASPGLADEAERVQRRATDEKLAQLLESGGIEAFVDYWESLPLWHSQQQLSPSTRQALHQSRLKNNPQGLANSLRGAGTGSQPPLWDNLAKLKMPVILITGELDEKFCTIANAMQQLLAQAKLEIISGAGHAVHLEQPAIFESKLTGFLKGLRV